MSTPNAEVLPVHALLAKLPSPSAHAAASPRFDGVASSVPLDALTAEGAAAIRALYQELEPVEGMVEGRRPFSLPGYRAAEADVRALATATAARDAASLAVHAIVGPRLFALSYEVPRWSSGRITQELHRRVGFLAAQQRRMMRVSFAGLDDAGVQADRASGPVDVADALAHWSRGSSDADPHGLTVEVDARAEGPVASSQAELAALGSAVQSIVMQAHARAPDATLTLAAERVNGVLRIAVVAPDAGAGGDPLAMAHAAALSSAAFGLSDEASVAAGLTGESSAEGGAVAWVSWPSLP